jgi:hypothetical protein
MTSRPLVLGIALAVVSVAAVLPAAGWSAGRTQTLRIYDKPVSIKLTHPNGTSITREPYPQPKPGDVLDVDSLDYVGTHDHHAAHWIGSGHLRCVFRAGPPTCESQVALGGSLLFFTGNPGTVSHGTGVYQGASGHVVSNKEVPVSSGGNNGSDIVVRIKLAG